MSTGVRVQVILADAEREAFRREAAREGRSLSAWLRDAGRERLAARPDRPITTIEELRALFARQAEHDGAGAEPDWPAQRAMIDHARRPGAAPT